MEDIPSIRVKFLSLNELQTDTECKYRELVLKSLAVTNPFIHRMKHKMNVTLLILATSLLSIITLLRYLSLYPT